MKVYQWGFEEKDFNAFAFEVGCRSLVMKATIDNDVHAVIGRTDKGQLLILTSDCMIAVGIDGIFASDIVRRFGMPDYMPTFAPYIKKASLVLDNHARDIYDTDQLIDEFSFDPCRDIPEMREYLGLPEEEEEEEEETEAAEETETRPLKIPTRPRQGGTPRIPRNQRGCENDSK